VTLLYQVVSDSDGSTPPSDAELILAVRGGDRHAYGILYERHLAAARAQARQLARSSADADDLVAEAFAKVFTILQGGGGPDSAFRAYLMTALRNCFYQRMRQDRRLELTDDMTRHDEGIPWSDPVAAELESSLAARAFSTLPARWQTVLWQSEVERQSTVEIGARLGLRPSAVAALAYRAREGLRQAYLQAHLAEHPDESCRPTVHRLGGWTRGRLAAGDTALVREHLARCGRCRGLAAELADVNNGIRGLLAPLAAAGYASGGLSAGSVGVLASGPAVGPTVASGAAAGAGGAAAGAAGGGSVVGSALGWLLGTHAGQAVAALTAVVVGGTAVAAGTGSVGPDHRAATAAATAAAGSARPVSPGADPGRVDFRLLVPGKQDEPSGKQPSGKSRNGKGPGDKPSGAQSTGRSAGRELSGTASGAAGPAGEPSGTQSTGRPPGNEPSGTPSGAAGQTGEPAATPPTGRSAGRELSGTAPGGAGPAGEPAATPPTGKPAASELRDKSRNGNGPTGGPPPAPLAGELPQATPTRGRSAPARSAKKEPAQAETHPEPARPGGSAGQ
jgi:RNA polymerase sigma factor (sigma-70 family)